jgi:Tle cognate immunity protein 4 C-terminal domain/Tle cognate immunity protein 4 N-terminal domain
MRCIASGKSYNWRRLSPSFLSARNEMPIAKTLMLLCASLVTLTCYAKEPQMNDTKTFCIGRYLVDLPADAQINGQTYDYKYGRIDSFSADKVGFEMQMTQREDQLRAGKQKDGYKLKDVLRPAPTVWIFELQQKLLMGPSVGFEAYKWIDDQAFQLSQEDTLDEKYAEVISTVKADVFPNLRARRAGKIPMQPGFCLKNGFIANDGKGAQYESAGMSFKVTHWPGVVITVNISTTTKSGEKTLLQRIDSAPVPAMLQSVIGQMKTLRKGKHEVNGREGEEVLWTFPTEEGFRTHQFQWEAQGIVDQPLRPNLTVEFESGEQGPNGAPQRSRLTDDEAIRGFDAVVNSIRLRPTDSSKTAENVPEARPPLGTLAQTGTACPQTGWWTCPEAVANQIEGGKRQRFDAGAVMPAVQVFRKQSLSERLTGRQQKHSVNTVWRLVAYDANHDNAPE